MTKRKAAATRLQALDPFARNLGSKFQLAGEAPAPAPSTKDLHRQDGRVMRKQTLVLEKELLKRLRHHCIEHGKNLSEVAGEALEKFLS